MKPQTFVSKNTRNLLLTGSVAALCAVSFSACGSDDSSGTKSDVQELKYQLTDDGCSPATSTATSGDIKFIAANVGTSKSDEFEIKNKDGIILGERENLAPGLSGEFTLTLQPGTYIVNCILASNGEDDPNYDNAKLVVTGGRVNATGAATDAKLNTAVADYKKYVQKETDELVVAVNKFVAALKAGKLQKAKDLFGPTRIHYERIEPIAESFGDLDPKIDARVNDVADRSTWTGFHRIEQILWQKKTTKGTEKLGKVLVKDVAELQKRISKVEVQPAQLANGAVGLLDEVSKSKITGEEDRYSRTDLSDFQGNLEGSRKAFELLVPALKARNETKLVKEIQGRFDDVQKGIDKYKRDTPLGFALYTELTDADRKKFSLQLDALAEPLSLVAGKILH